MRKNIGLARGGGVGEERWPRDRCTRASEEETCLAVDRGAFHAMHTVRTHARTHARTVRRSNAPRAFLFRLTAPPPRRPRPVSPRRCLVLPLFSRRKARACAYARTSATRPSSAALLPPPRLSSPHLPYHAAELQLSVAQWLSSRPRPRYSRRAESHVPAPFPSRFLCSPFARLLVLSPLGTEVSEGVGTFRGMLVLCNREAILARYWEMVESDVCETLRDASRDAGRIVDSCVARLTGSGTVVCRSSADECLWWRVLGQGLNGWANGLVVCTSRSSDLKRFLDSVGDTRFSLLLGDANWLVFRRCSRGKLGVSRVPDMAPNRNIVSSIS